jgi:hypothetical protein
METASFYCLAISINDAQVDQTIKDRVDSRNSFLLKNSLKIVDNPFDKMYTVFW